MQRYISSELTHFVGRGLTEKKQYEILVKILSEGFLSHAPHVRSLGGNLNVNFNASFSKNEMYNPEMVCFCDIPFEDLTLHMNKYSRFGLAFGKKFIVSKGGKPVMYIPTSSIIRADKELSPEAMAQFGAEKDPYFKAKLLFEEHEIGGCFDEMIREYHLLSELTRKLFLDTFSNPGVPEESHRLFALNLFLEFHIFSFIKFFDPSLLDNDPSNYYFEREWRVIGNIDFKLIDITRIVLPVEYSERFRIDFPGYFGQVSFSGQNQAAT